MIECRIHIEDVEAVQYCSRDFDVEFYKEDGTERTLATGEKYCLMIKGEKDEPLINIIQANKHFHIASVELTPGTYDMEILIRETSGDLPYLMYGKFVVRDRKRGEDE